MGRGKKIHRVHGRATTLSEEAARLGVTPVALQNQMSKKRMSLEAVAELYESGQVRRGVRGEVRHCVHGEWMTASEAAARLGYAKRTLQNYSSRHRCLLEEAYDHFAAVRAGEIPAQRRREGRRYWVGNRKLTVREAAERAGVPPRTVYGHLYRGESLAQAMKAIEARKEKLAERELLRILRGEPEKRPRGRPKKEGQK